MTITMREKRPAEPRQFRSIAEIREAFYPHSAWLLDLPDGAIVAWQAPTPHGVRRPADLTKETRHGRTHTHHN